MPTSIGSSWLIGAFELTSNATIVVDGINNAVVPAGEYYLDDPSSSLSLLSAILTAVTPFMTTPAVFIGLDRKIHVTAGAAFTWAIPVSLQPILGFGASIPSTTSATAADISTLLWSPGWPETTLGHPVGTTGWIVPQWTQTSSPSGQTIRTTQLGDPTQLTELAWNFVLRARTMTSDLGEPGEYQRFFIDVLVPGRRFKLYRGILEDDGDPSAAPITSPLGPYKIRDPDFRWYERAIPDASTHANIDLKAQATSELS